jgi:hypothetical protein
MKRVRGGFDYISGKKYDGMLGRCYRKNDGSFKLYGGRGIRVCLAWIEDIDVFRAWVREQLAELGVTEQEFAENSAKYQLDRHDCDGHYTPENCRFVSAQKNMRNTRNRERLEIVSAEGIKIAI